MNPSDAARELGRSKSERKANAARKNGKKPKTRRVSVEQHVTPPSTAERFRELVETETLKRLGHSTKVAVRSADEKARQRARAKAKEGARRGKAHE